MRRTCKIHTEGPRPDLNTRPSCEATVLPTAPPCCPYYYYYYCQSQA
uniref:Uncharacterized protein n=1 Tax=Anguilla anguilla TaxID=7936 RepID=A0A0E9RNM3_ANGAN